MSTEPIFYEERRRWTPRALTGAVIVTPLVAAFIAAAFVTHAWLLLLFAAYFGLGLVGVSHGAATHASALRVDERGVSLTRATVPGRAREPVLVRWSEAEAVVLGKTPRYKRLDALYVLTTADETPGGIKLLDLAVTPADRRLPLTNWSIDIGRLSEAVRAHAPTVTVLDQR